MGYGFVGLMSFISAGCFLFGIYSMDGQVKELKNEVASLRQKVLVYEIKLWCAEKTQ